MKQICVALIFLLCFSFSAFALEGRVAVPLSDSPLRGSNSASVTIIEFLDFQ